MEVILKDLESGKQDEAHSLPHPWISEWCTVECLREGFPHTCRSGLLFSHILSICFLASFLMSISVCNRRYTCTRCLRPLFTWHGESWEEIYSFRKEAEVNMELNHFIVFFAHSTSNKFKQLVQDKYPNTAEQ